MGHAPCTPGRSRGQRLWRSIEKGGSDKAQSQDGDRRFDTFKAGPLQARGGGQSPAQRPKVAGKGQSYQEQEVSLAGGRVRWRRQGSEAHPPARQADRKRSRVKVSEKL